MAMRFKTTDLMVTVLPRAEIGKELAAVCLLQTKICKSPTFNCPGCSLLATCLGCSANPTCQCSFVPSCVGCSVAISCHGTCYGCSVAISFCGTGCSQLASNCAGCSALASIGCPGNSCGAGGSACDPTYVTCFGSRDPLVIENLEDLVTLRADLQETLKQLDVLEKEGGFQSGIASRADADAMEKALTQALEQVRKARETLK